MEKDTEKQIINELKEINQTLNSLSNRIIGMEEKPTTGATLLYFLKSLLIKQFGYPR